MFDSRTSLYAEPMFPYILGAAFGVFVSAIGAALGDSGFSRILTLTGGFVGLAMFILAFIELLDQREINGHRLENMRLHNKLLAKELEPQAIVTAPAERVPFPPMRFVDFIWTMHERDGKFPTVDVCEAAGMNRQLVQSWYQQCVDAGAITNRIPKQYAGDPFWDREHFERATRADNTIHNVN